MKTLIGSYCYTSMTISQWKELANTAIKELNVNIALIDMDPLTLVTSKSIKSQVTLMKVLKRLR